MVAIPLALLLATIAACVSIRWDDPFMVQWMARIAAVNYLLVYFGVCPTDRPSSLRLSDCFVLVTGIAILIGLFRETIGNLLEGDSRFKISDCVETAATLVESAVYLFALRLGKPRAMHIAMGTSMVILSVSIGFRMMSLQTIWVDVAFRLSWLISMLVVFSEWWRVRPAKVVTTLGYCE